MSNQSKKNTAGKLNTLEEPEQNNKIPTSEELSDNPNQSRASRQISTALNESENKSENKSNSIQEDRKQNFKGKLIVNYYKKPAF